MNQEKIKRFFDREYSEIMENAEGFFPLLLCLIITFYLILIIQSLNWNIKYQEYFVLNEMF